MNKLFVIGLLAVLAGCGAEGDPLRPTAPWGQCRAERCVAIGGRGRE